MRPPLKIAVIIAVLVIGLGALLSIVSPADRSPKAKAPRPVTGEFRHKVYRIDDRQSVTVFEVPDQYGPNRCWVYANVDTNTTNMHCGGESDDMPAQGPELER